MEKNEENRKRVMKALHDNGIKTVNVEYEGSGDDGQIDDVTFVHKTNVDHMKDSITVIKESSKFEDGQWHQRESEEEVDLEEAVRDLCYEILSSEHPGWEINDGSRGEFTFNVEEDTIKLEHTDYYTESTTTESEF